MSKKRTPEQIRQKCIKEIDAFFDEALRAVLRSSDDVSTAFRAFSMRMVNGINFRIDDEIVTAERKMAIAIAEAAGSQNASIPDIREKAYSVLADIVSEMGELDDIDRAPFKKKFRNLVVENSLGEYSIVAPCNIFRFENCEPLLRSSRVRVMSSQRFVDEGPILKNSKRSKLIAKDGPWENTLPIDGNVYVYGDVWWIDCASPKDLAEQSGRWLAEIYISALRVGLKAAKFCHRSRLGECESHPFGDAQKFSKKIVFNGEKSFHAGSSLQHQYKVDEEFLSHYNASEFQEKLTVVLDPEEGTVGERLSNSLGWFTRGRQAENTSERLLHFFTSLESLLSEKNEFHPIADSIARFASVILTHKPSDRENTYKEIKALYTMRSQLVHRGIRSAHHINGNNIEYICSRVLSVVWHNVDLNMKHDEFIKELKSASHGGEWPISPPQS